jgi:hypothetical protein
MIEQLAAALGIKSKAVLLWGLIGAMLSMYFAQPGMRFVVRAVYCAGGTACAYVGAPALAEYFTLSEAATGAVGFVLGVFGMSLLAALQTIIRESKWGEQIATWVKRPGS